MLRMCRSQIGAFSFFNSRMLSSAFPTDVLDMLKNLIVDKNGCMPLKAAYEIISLSPSLLHLKTVEIIYKSYPSISSLLKFLLENAHVHQKMVLQQLGEEYNQQLEF